MNRVEVKRKVRSDKKRDVKPTVKIELHDCLSRISYITSTPIKCVGEFYCNAGLANDLVVNELSNYFRRSYRVDNTVYIGDMSREPYMLEKGVLKKRVSLRFNQNQFDRIENLGYVLGVTVSSATGLLLEKSLKNVDLLQQYVEEYADIHFIKTDYNRAKQLEEVYKFINKDSPYKTKTSLTDFLKALYIETKYLFSD